LVRAKKFLGQHFLNDQGIAKQIVDSLVKGDNQNVLEIGPGTGVLTKFLVQDKTIKLKTIEIDWDSVAHLKKHYPALSIIEGDFLTTESSGYFRIKFLHHRQFSIQYFIADIL
jgi:16S rRNA (adenine1518-N6/adenine1519-N6)-dimethyltransferase